MKSSMFKQLVYNLSHHETIITNYRIIKSGIIYNKPSKLPIYTENVGNLVWANNINKVSAQRKLDRKCNHIKSIYESVIFTGDNNVYH